MRRIFTLLMIALFATSAVMAQKVAKISGQVTDGTTREPMAGVTVHIHNKTVGTTTDARGAFTLKAAPEDVLVFSFLGYSSRRVTVGNQVALKVSLKAEAQDIDELVVVGYGSLRKSDMTGAVASLNAQDVTQSSSLTDVTGLFDGTVAGVMMEQGEGGPGMGATISIRGASSLNADTSPLYVIDGFPMDTETTGTDSFTGGAISPMASIDPNNIKSIEILKDASATAIYGSRGANGVVLITTKEGQAGRTKINFSGSVGVSSVTNKLDLLDSKGYAKFMYYRTFEGSANPYLAEQTSPNTGNEFYDYESYADSTNNDWQDIMYNTAITQNYNVNVSGGTDKVTYNVSGGYFDDKGIILNNDFKRYSLDTKIHAILSPKFTLDLSSRMGHTISNGVASGVGGNTTNYGVVAQILRYSPLNDFDTEILSDLDSDYELSSDERSNPYTFVNESTNRSYSTRMILNAAVTYKILKDLSYKASMGANFNITKKESFYPSSTARGHNDDGKASSAFSQSRTWVHESILTYNKTFNKDNRLNAVAGFTAQQNFSDQVSVGITEFQYEGLGVSNLGFGTDPGIPSSSESTYSMLSLLSRINYTFKNRYLFTVSGRADGSSRFRPGNKWSYFPSGSVAWRASEESWLKEYRSWLANLKFRASYGKTGNQAIGAYDSMGKLTSANYTFNNTTTSGLGLSSVNSDDLKWETTAQYDFGVDLGLFKNRLQFTADYYHKKTTDMLMDVEVSNVLGYDKLQMNYGDMENKGLELSLRGTIMKKKNFNWDANTNFTFNRNKVLSVGNAEYLASDYARVIVGKPVGQFWGYKQIGIIENEEELAKYNQEGTYLDRMNVGQRKFADLDPSSSTSTKTVIDTNDMTIIGSYEPKFYGGFATSVNYKNFGLSMQFTFKYGGDIYNGNKPDLICYERSFNRLAEALDYWDPVHNPNALNPHPSSRDLSKYIDVYIEDGSYLRMSSITLSYNFNKGLLSRLHMSSLMAYVRANDIFTLSGYSGYDPRASVGGKLYPGYDRGATPFVTTISVGINVGL